MIPVSSTTPVVILNATLGSLAIMRTLGYLGVPVYIVPANRKSFALRSRYCRGKFEFPFNEKPEEALVRHLEGVASRFDTKPVLIATSDETAICVANHYERLSKVYLIGQNGGDIVATLADKMSMFDLARKHGVPAPMTFLPQNADEARQYASQVAYPVMLKGAMGNRMYERTGKKMVVVENADELIEQYGLLEDPEIPNLMIQELIPGGDDEVYIFNGYFNRSSDCVAGFTGRKIRQYPIHVGCASLGELCTVPEVAELTTRFMKEIGYRGILDIGYRKDPRDGQYKVLDINPRVGQAFRMFVSKDNLDVIRVMYLDLTGQKVPQPIVPREGRRWMIEDYDLVSTFHYFQERSLGFGEWIRSFRRLEEGAWFALRDPVPFVWMLGDLVRQTMRWFRNRIFGRASA